MALFRKQPHFRLVFMVRTQPEVWWSSGRPQCQALQCLAQARANLNIVAHDGFDAHGSLKPEAEEECWWRGLGDGDLVTAVILDLIYSCDTMPSQEVRDSIFHAPNHMLGPSFMDSPHFRGESSMAYIHLQHQPSRWWLYPEFQFPTIYQLELFSIAPPVLVGRCCVSPLWKETTIYHPTADVPWESHHKNGWIVRFRAVSSVRIRQPLTVNHWA